MKRYYIYIFIVIILLLIISIKLFTFYDKTSLVFSSYKGFKVNGDTIIGCNIKGGNIVIPEKIDGVTITKIGDYAFSGLNIDNIRIPDSIISIGDYAFADNNIKSLKIPSSVQEIGEGAFIHNNISSLELSSKVEIGNACFNDNDLALEEAFFVKENELISYGGNIKGNVLIPDVVSIGKKAFFETYIVSVTLPDTVTTIEDEAFKSNYLVEIYLSDKINFVSETAFSDNIYLSEIIINNNSSNLLNYPWGAISSNLYWLK